MNNKTKLGLLFSLVVIIGVAVYTLVSQKTEDAISPDQQKVVDVMGYPEQFVVTYVESGSENNPQLVRNEIWFYPENGIKVGFLGGNLAYSEEYTATPGTVATKYKPEDFEFALSYTDLQKIIGKDNLNEVYDLPGITDSGDIKVYTDGEIMLVVENGYLTYIQTFSYTEGEAQE